MSSPQEIWGFIIPDVAIVSPVIRLTKLQAIFVVLMSTDNQNAALAALTKSVTMNGEYYSRLSDDMMKKIALPGFETYPLRFNQDLNHVEDYSRPLSLGSRASLKPSPIMLKANTTSIIATPGAKDNIGLTVRYR
jgi:hypothetical protein